MKKSVTIPSVLKKMNRIFEENGCEAFLVGGAVRDMLRGKSAHDWDIATNAKPHDVMRMFRKVIPTGIAHGTVTVHFMGEEIEVTTYRLESTYSDGRHPDSVIYATNIEADLSRRDFTMNAIAASLKDGSLVDPFGGERDIQDGVIRTVGAPLDRFTEDGLRPIRAIRFAAQTGFAIDGGTLAAIPEALSITQKVSIERFRDEFSKLLVSPAPLTGLRLLEETGILGFFIPELTAARGVVQADARGHHRFDVLDHLFYAVEGAAWLASERSTSKAGTALAAGGASAAPASEAAPAHGSADSAQDTATTTDPQPTAPLVLRLAALFHDIGKPATRRVEYRVFNPALDPAHPETESEIYTFYNHENVGATMTSSILSRLRYPNKIVRYVSHLVKNHMFHYEPSWTDAAVRRFLVRATPDAQTAGSSAFRQSPSASNAGIAGDPEVRRAVDDLFDLRICDVCGMEGIPAHLKDGPWVENLLEFRGRIDKVLAEKNTLSLKNLAVTGRDLIEAGIPGGKAMGAILAELLDTVLDDPSVNTAERLLPLARNLYEKRKNC